jgi:cardiolipin synthase
VYRYHKMTHVKAMICDDWATVGSANLDTLSMHINRELNLAFSDPRAVRALEEKIFLPDQRRSTKILPSEMKKITEGIAEVIADQL